MAQNRQPRNTEYGPSWVDVGEYVLDLHRTTGCKVEVSMHTEMIAGRVRNYWKVHSKAPLEGEWQHTAPLTVGEFHPTVDHATVPGLLFALLMRLDIAIEAQRSRARVRDLFD